MKTILFSLFFAFTGLGSLINQTFVWDHYGIAVDVPDDFKVLKISRKQISLNYIPKNLLFDAVFSMNFINYFSTEIKKSSMNFDHC
mgnify:CR=1 FL=1